MFFQGRTLRLSAMTLFVTAALMLLNGCGSEVVTADKSPRPVKAIELSAPSQFQPLTLPTLLVPVQQAQLAFRVAGPVAEVKAVEGQPVTAGDTLLALDPHDFQVQVDEYQARLVEAKAQALQAKQEQARVIAANQGDAIAKVELDRAAAAVKRADAGVVVVQKRLQMMQDALAYSSLEAPFDGVVASVDIEAHEQAVPAIDVITIHGNQGYELELDLPEKMAQQVYQGMLAEVVLEGSEQRHSVEIHEISRSANPLSRTFTATARFFKQPQQAWPEQTGLVTINLPLAQQVGFELPSHAVQGEKNGKYVVTVKDGVAERVAVTVAGFNGDRIQVQGALNVGDRVVTAGAPYLNHGDAVGAVLLGDDAAAL